MTTSIAGPVYATPADPGRIGDYRIVREPGDTRPLYRFRDRLGAQAEPGRFHLYAGWFCPWAQRSTLVVALAGLQDAVSVSYVDGARDARGWAFRETSGPDPVNGFVLLRDAYEATEPGFDGHVSVPTLWDRRTRRVVSNDYGLLDADLATAFLHLSTTGLELYPAALRDRVDELDRWLGPAVNAGVTAAQGDGEQALSARARLNEAFEALDARLAGSRFLLGDRLTLADVRLWVTLVRYDVQANATGALGGPLADHPQLWDYARDLYQRQAFRSTTDLSTFTAPGALVPDWERPTRRSAGVAP
ncbi:glutathione S-transferase C-terminal domain-containing protein [Motilibacter peucedani]|uniref:glutathione S-transferase C-terminal domain-containing protein n=1 Tax=Motilibacter peucedani TaxID=598650 RepID=UPI001E5602D4|nr:glutathione S-transferase C-terminal domain-containing protein [Motilibacter peucedani]